MEQLILTRKFKHPEMAHNDQLYCRMELNSTNWLEDWGVHQDCYVCQNHNILTIDLDSLKNSEQIKDQNLIDLLKKLYKINDSDQNGAPIFISSINNWIKTRFLSKGTYCQIIKSRNEEFSFKLASELR
jgi:hypothetical protein